MHINSPQPRIPFEIILLLSTITMDRNVASSSIIIACFLLFLFTFSYARTPFDSIEVDIDHNTNHDSFPVSEKNPVDAANDILLPSQKPEPEPATLIQYEPHSKTSKPRAETVESMEVPTATESSEASNPLPFTVLSFRPTDPSRIPRRPLPLSFRPVHSCHRIQNHHHYKPWDRHLPRRGRNDLITNINTVEGKDFDPVTRGGGMRRIPVGWMRFGHVEPMFLSRERNMAMEKSELLRRLYHRYHQRRQEAAAEIKNDTGFVQRIRKFLNRF